MAPIIGITTITIFTAMRQKLMPAGLLPTWHLLVA